MRKILLCFLLLFLVSNASAVCTVTLDKTSYSPTETVIADIVCSAANEQSQSYTLNWTNSTGQKELDTGITPSSLNVHFTKTYVLPLAYADTINATLTGTNLEGTDGANVTGLAANSLIITNITIGGKFLGLVNSLQAIIKDENSKKISGATCHITILSNDQTKVLVDEDSVSSDGKIRLSWIPSYKEFTEGVDYVPVATCYCGLTGTTSACIDEEGTEVVNSIGTASGTFMTNTWISFNQNPLQITDKDGNNLTDPALRAGEDLVYWKRNATNNATVPLKAAVTTYLINNATGVTYGKANEGSKVVSERTFAVGTESLVFNHLISSEAPDGIYKIRLFFDVTYENLPVAFYTVNTETFNVSGGSIFIAPEFQQLSGTRYQSKINLTNYSLGVRDVKVLLNSLIADQATPISRIYNVSVTYWNGTATSYSSAVETGVNPSTNLENSYIKIKDVNTTLGDIFNVTLDIVDWEERQTDALEGIENKTGTFHLDVSCPSTGIIGEDIQCIITAYVEDSQIVQKEVDFTCGISDGVSTYSSTNFNQMITRSAVSISKSFTIPHSFNSGQQYVLQCHADYYNLGSRRDSFYDSFTANTATGGGAAGNNTGRAPITGDIVDEKIPLPEGSSPKINWAIWLIILIIVAGLIALLKFKNKCHDPYYSPQKNWKEIAGKIFLILLGILIIATLIMGMIYGYNSIKNNLLSSSDNISNLNNQVSALPVQPYSLLQDGLFRGIILTAFIALIIIALFKALNLRGEIKFGEDYSVRIFKEDKKSEKLQQKLNHLILEEEIKKQATKEDYKTRKITQEEFKNLFKKNN